MVSNQLYVGKTPWHGAGRKIDAGQTVVESLSQDRILSSTIDKSPVMAGADDGSFVDCPGHFALMRRADKRIVGYCGDGYTISQHLDLGAFADSIAAQYGLTFEIAGTLRRGSQFVLQAKVGNPEVVAELADGRGDSVQFYLTLGTAHDGVKPTEFGFATYRAECANMTAAAMAEVRTGKRGVRYFAIRHNGDLQAKLAEAGKALREGFQAWGDFLTFARKAATTTKPQTDFADFAQAIFADPEGDKNPARAQAKRDDLFSLFTKGQGNQGRTAWDAYNAVTEWTNYSAPTRGATTDNDRTLSRINSTLYGTGAEMAVEAESLLRVYVSAN